MRLVAITLEQAQGLIDGAVKHAAANDLQPLTVAVLDPGGVLVALARQDGSGLLRPDLAVAKAWGVLGLGMNNRAIAARAESSPEFFTSVATLAQGRVLSVPGGVFIRDAEGALLGACGATGDTSVNDELALLAGIESVGLRAETGAEVEV
ncbi:GlcG/HbpS family heme-binding protein [Nocardiopsis lucentensis]|uniref:GlcG/HbpS family heme-binding protein n=1 Tax=Nocardiopsis lucentensis TaxID=53441 RepID=UPI00034D30D0